MAKLGSLVVNIGANTKDLNKKLGRVQRNMKSMTSNITKLGRSMSASLTLPLAAIAGKSLKLAIDFEASMAKVKAVSGATGAEFKSLEDTAKRLGSTTVFTASEVSGLMLEYSKLGFSAAQINEVSEATLYLAQATGSDLAEAAAVAGATLGGFGLAAKETGRVTDVMAASFSSSALDIGLFKDSMKFVAPVAKIAGVSLEETTAMLGVLANAGIKGSMAGTALRRIFGELAEGSGTVTEKLANLSKAGLTLADSKDEVGRSAQSALLVLANGVPDIDKFNSALLGSGGAAKAAADIMNNTTEGALKAMGSALEGAAIVIGDALAPALKSVAKFVTGLASDFSNLSKTTQKNILIFAGVLAILGPMLIIIPKIIAGIKATRIAWIALNASLLLNPIYLVTAAIVALGVVMVATSGDIHNSKKETDKYIESLKTLDRQAQLNAINSKIRKEKDKLTAANKSLATSELLVARASDKFDRKIATDSVNRYKAIVEGLTGSLGMLEEELDSIHAMGGIGGVIGGDDGLDDGLDDGGGLVKIIAPEQMKLLEALPIKLIAIKKPLKELQQSTVNLGDSIKTLSNKTIVMAEAFGNAFGEMAAGAKTGKEAFKSFAIDAIRSIIGIAKANVIAAATSPLNPANALSGGLTAPAFALAGLSALDALLANVPALAEGGLAYGPTLAMVGDNKGANVDPEVVAPLSKLKDMLGGNSIQVYGRISGDDIVISNTRASRDRNRF